MTSSKTSSKTPDNTVPATVIAFIKQHPVLSYYALTFTISWGGFLLVGGRGLFAGTNYRTDPMFLPAVWAMVAGPTIASLLLTGLISGRAGFGELLSRLLRWQVGARWYAVALLTTPVVATAILVALSRTSSVYLPGIVTTGDKVALLLAGVAVGLIGGMVEELGWTGFAIPRLRLHYSMLTTGLIMGVLWAAWHVLQILWVGLTTAAGLPMALFLSVYIVSAVLGLTAYRVLMVWVYDRTRSLLVAILMHASYIFCTLFVLSPVVVELPFLIYGLVLPIAMWLVVAAVLAANGVAHGGPLWRQPLRGRAA